MKVMKTNDVVCWAVVDKHREAVVTVGTRMEARKIKTLLTSKYPWDNPFRIAKLVVSK